MEQNTKTESTSLARVSHVNLSVWPDLVRALMMSVRYGRKWSEFSEMLNPLGSSERTFQGCLPLDNTEENTSTTSAIRYPKWGIALDGAYMELKTLEQSIVATGSSLLPTPSTFDAKTFKKKDLSDKTTKNGKRGGRSNLREVDFENMLATPRASQDHKPIRPLAPTEANGTHGKTLVADIGNQFPEVTGESGTQPPSCTRPVLNPEFVERMMGFPIGWTDLNVSETR
jgi:hypothetical protein